MSGMEVLEETGQRLQLKVSGSPEALGETVERVEEFSRKIGFSEEQIDRIKLSVDEACSNVIEHGYNFAPERYYQVICERLENGIKIVIKDDAKHFSPPPVTPPDPEAELGDIRIGGLGRYFMGVFMDKVWYNTELKEGNELTMIKYLQKP
ncbi:MAG: ATP-binding protein [Nitrospirota bacterium]